MRWTNLHLYSCLTLGLTCEAQRYNVFSRQLAPYVSAIASLLGGNGLAPAASGTLQGLLGRDQEFDYVVVGGGTGGNAIGYRLAEAGFSVAIVEAGTFFEFSKPGFSTIPGLDVLFVGSESYEALSAADWKFQTTPQQGADNRKFHVAQGKCVGGSSAWNFMIHHRGPTGVLDQWAQSVGDDSYKFDSFEPYYKKSVTFTPGSASKRPAGTWSQSAASDFASAGQGGPVQVSYTNFVSDWSLWLQKGLAAVGLKETDGFDRGSLLGYHYTTTTTRQSDATRSSSAEYVYAANKKGLKNLKVFTNTQASKINFDSGKKASSVTVLSAINTEYTIKAKKEIIVSAGAYSSPQLLMLSGIGPEDTLNQHGIPIVSALPGVGQNMWDHIFFGPSHAVKFKTIDSILHNLADTAVAVSKYLLSHSGILASNGIEMVGWEKLPAQLRGNFSAETKQKLDWFSEDWPEVEFLGGNGYIGTFGSLLTQQPTDGRQYATLLGALVAPLSRGNVTIASTSVRDQPVINPNWLTDEGDQQVAVALMKRLRQVWATPELQSISDGDEYFPGEDVQTDEALLEVVRQSLMTVWHPSCTCKMGKKEDKMAVVDSSARVFGVQGLRVVDASAFPILPPGHPMATIYALAEKIAEDVIRTANQ
ncbi:choline dehydrogenase [Cordyceps fumosorosea ARSEF 2679]|uniref:Choline dehydrogenase n=1 Tax=Cordyceps fumosorosea (strain ARSEF 2679) TaxID=1081104 RepID=A0A167LH39_CORFA|nr:choline dehydrogenase [Cordyceps fumosorosea ARSEF 2679]OAA53083.1 choline dehydrogenase [Cordyceps fumosorosea ARSEF 2679]